MPSSPAGGARDWRPKCTTGCPQPSAMLRSAWFLRSRRMVRDYERHTDTSEAVGLWSMTMPMSRRLGVHQRRSVRVRAAWTCPVSFPPAGLAPPVASAVPSLPRCGRRTCCPSPVPLLAAGHPARRRPFSAHPTPPASTASAPHDVFASSRTRLPVTAAISRLSVNAGHE